MEQKYPVDVIAVCSADGQIRPLRLRLENESKQLQRMDIDQIIRTDRVPYIGVEALLFLCTGYLEGRCRLFELKFTIRSHSWSLERFLH